MLLIWRKLSGGERAFRPLAAGLIFFLLWAVGAGTARAEPKPPEDFRGVKWGAEIEGLEGMVPIEWAKISPVRVWPKTPLDGEGFYIREGDELLLGDIPVSRIIYCFYNGRFYKGKFIIQDCKKHEKDIRKLLTKAYGPEIAKSKIGRASDWFLPMGESYIGVQFLCRSRARHVIFEYGAIKDELNQDIQKLAPGGPQQ